MVNYLRDFLFYAHAKNVGRYISKTAKYRGSGGIQALRIRYVQRKGCCNCSLFLFFVKIQGHM